jgi:D-tagatose-1,6-bisphosphate aldolase subunit GatZ/KbaZ
MIDSACGGALEMGPIQGLIRSILQLRREGQAQITLLAVCPNSVAVLEAAVKVAAENHMPMLFAATLNQVDRDGGYTGWTANQFVALIGELSRKYHWDGPLYPCLDHGGPWLKDKHSLEGFSYEATMAEVKESITACLQAGYRLLHIDPTVDRTLAPDAALAVHVVVDRTIELINHSETERQRLHLPAIDYEVGTEEVHGGLVDLDRFEIFLELLHVGLVERNLGHAWPSLVVAQVGTDLHTTWFDAEAAGKLFSIVAPLGTLVKGHYTDWVENPQDYPATGMGGANIGPEFTSEEYLALRHLAAKEDEIVRERSAARSSQFMQALQQAVIDSGRWGKWLLKTEKKLAFDHLTTERREWLLQTGSRYVWTTPAVCEARQHLYENLSRIMPNPHGFVIDRIAACMQRYVNAFNLYNSITLFKATPAGLGF